MVELTTTPIIDIYRSKADQVPEVRRLLPFADIERSLMRRRLQAKQESGTIEATTTQPVGASGTSENLISSMYAVMRPFCLVESCTLDAAAICG